MPKSFIKRSLRPINPLEHHPLSSSCCSPFTTCQLLAFSPYPPTETSLPAPVHAIPVETWEENETFSCDSIPTIKPPWEVALLATKSNLESIVQNLMIARYVIAQCPEPQRYLLPHANNCIQTSLDALRGLAEDLCSMIHSLPPSVEGHGKITASGLTQTFVDAAKTGLQIASVVGMLNPVGVGSENISEESKPLGDETFDAPTTTIESLASSMQFAAPIVQDTISESFQPMKPPPKQGGYKSEMASFSYAAMASRPVICGTPSWTTAQARGTEIFRFRIPEDLNTLSDSLLLTTFRQHALCAWDAIEFTVQYNANPFVSGFARVSFIPSEYYTDASNNYVRAITGNGVDLNASSMTQASLIAPFCYNQNWIATQGMWPHSMRSCGTLVIYPIIPLRGVESDSPSLPLRITLQIHGLRLAAPVPPIDLPLFQLTHIPPVVVQGQGKEDTASVVYFPRSNAFSNYEDGTHVLRNSARENLARDLVQDETDPMELRYILEKPGISKYFNWSVDDQPGTILSSSIVCPIDVGTYAQPITPLSYYSRFASRWNGSIKYKLMIAKSAFHTGKIAVVQIPIDFNVTASNYLAFNHIIFDLKEDNIIEFEVSFFSDHATLLVPRPDPIPGLHYGSTISIIAHTALQANASMQSDISCAQWVSAGSDFQLYSICLPAPQAATTWTLRSDVGQDFRQGIGSFSDHLVFNFGHFLPTVPPVGEYTLPTLTFNGQTFTRIYVFPGSLASNKPYLVTSYNIRQALTAFQRTLSPATAEIVGQSGITSAMHDKLQTPILTLGEKSDNSHPNMAYEKFDSLLQILERPHSIALTNFFFSFTGVTSENPDPFSAFQSCFAYTVGSIQTISVGAEQIRSNPTMDNIAPPSLVDGAVVMPTPDVALIVDHPPMTDAAIKMNLTVQDPERLETSLTQFSILDQDSAQLYVRAGQGFSYHLWCGIPSLGEQDLLQAQSTATMISPLDLPFSRLTLDGQIAALQARARRSSLVIGQGRNDTDEPKEKRSSKIRKYLAKKIAPRTSHDVQILASPTESESEDEDEDSTPSSSTETTPESRTYPPKHPFVPQAVHDTSVSVRHAADNVSDLVKDSHKVLSKIDNSILGMRRDFKTFTTKTNVSVKKTAHKIRRAASSLEKVSHRGSDLIESAHQFVAQTTETVSEDGLLSLLFGSSSTRSKLIQILLVDAVECITLRSMVKWAGMLIKLGIALGLTRKLIDSIVNLFKARTIWSAPTENQQGVIEGQSAESCIPMITSLVTVIVMFSTFAFSGGTKINAKKTETMWDWIAERARQTNMIDRGMDSLFKLFDKVNAWTVKCIKKFLPLDPELYSSLREERFLKSCKEFSEQAMPLMKVKVLVRIFADWDLRKSVFAIDDLYTKILEYSTDPDIARKHNSLFQKINAIAKELRNRIISLADATTVRIDPYHISLYGTSGAGKSYLMSALAFVLGRSQNVPNEDLFYSRTPSSKFWDNYRGQEWIGIDDVDQQDNEEMAGEMITLKSNVPKIVPMAHLETKGCMVTSRGILSSTNVPYPEPKSIKCKTAYKRRRNVLVECRMIPGRKLAQDLSHLVFYLRCPVDSTLPPLAGPYNFPELCSVLSVSYFDYLEQQHQLVKRVAPHTPFRALYRYENDDSSRLKILQLVKEFVKDDHLRDDSIRSHADIKTDDSFLIYDDPLSVIPEDFTSTHEIVPKKRLTVEEDIDSDLDDDNDQELFDEINNLVEGHGKSATSEYADAETFPTINERMKNLEYDAIFEGLISDDALSPCHESLYNRLSSDWQFYSTLAFTNARDPESAMEVLNKDLMDNMLSPRWVPKKYTSVFFPSDAPASDFRRKCATVASLLPLPERLILLAEMVDQENGARSDSGLGELTLDSLDLEHSLLDNPMDSDVNDLNLLDSALNSDHLSPDTISDAQDYVFDESEPHLLTRVANYLTKIFDSPTGHFLMAETNDLLYTLSSRRFGASINDCPPDLPFSIPGNGRAREYYLRIRNFCRRARMVYFKDSTDSIYAKIEFALDLAAYHYDAQRSEGCTTFERVGHVTNVAYFIGRAIHFSLAFAGHQVKLGLFSRLLRNFNNRLIPDTGVAPYVVESVRTAVEVIIVPLAIVQRLAWEARTYISSAAKLVATTIYTCITERQLPEMRVMVKVGLFLLGGYALYHLVLKKTGWFGVKRTKTEGEMKIPEILEKSHKQLPDDGSVYTHYHQCEKCRKVFSHAHAKTSLSHTYALLCGPCLKRVHATNKESARCGKSVPAQLTEGILERDPSELTVEGEAIASSGGSLREKFQKKMKIKGESQSAGEDNVRDMFSAKKDSSWRACLPHFFNSAPTPPPVVGQASDDPSLLNILPAIRNNCVTINTQGRSVNGIMLCGKWMVTVAHIFLNTHDKELPYCINWKGEKFQGYINTFTEIHFPEPVVIDGRKCPDDVCFVDMRTNRTLPAYRDIRSHIATRDDVDLIVNSPGLLVEKDHRTGDFTHHSLQRLVPVADRTISTPRTGETPVRTHVAISWHYNVSLDSGSCGSPLLVRNTHCQRKLAGFHYGAERTSTLSYAYPLIREIVDRYISDDDVIGHCSTDDIELKCEKVFNVFPADLPFDHGLTVVPSGRCLIVGKLKQQFIQRMPSRTDIVASPYKDQIFDHKTEPAILSDNDPRSPGNIIQQGLDKFGRVHENVRSPSLLRKIVAYKLQKMEKYTRDYNGPLRTLTEDEAINGIIGNSYIPPLRMDTSPGFPYVKLRPSGSTGRKFLFEELEPTVEGQPRYRPGPLLRRHLDDIWSELLNGNLILNYYLDCLKDERRPLNRLYKTRFFNIHNVAWLITYRRLYLAAAAFRLSTKFVLGTALGIDMHGPDASTLMNYMREAGNRYLAVDVKEWDGNLPSEELASSFDLNARFLNLHEAVDKRPDSAQNAKRREALTYGITTRIHIAGDCVYLAFQGMPSGHGGTADNNSDTHDTQNYANWYEIWMSQDNPEMAQFEQKDFHTREVTLGDDGGGCVSDVASLAYNNTTVALVYAHYGLQCQLPSKSNTGEIAASFTSVEDFEFLKCGFERDSQFRTIWHMQMAKKVIEELTNWVTIHGDPYDLFYSNMKDAQLFAFGHGQDYYDNFTNTVNDVLAQYQEPLLATTYHDQRSYFLEKFGKLVR